MAISEQKDKQKIKVVPFSKHLHWIQDYKQLAETTAEIGFDGLDLTIRPQGHVKPEKVEDDLPKVVEACNDAGIEVTMLCATVNDVSDPITEKVLKTASQLGIEFYRMGWYFYDFEKSLDANLVEFKAKMKDLAAMNEAYQVKGGYQNHNGVEWFGAPVWDLGQILNEIDSPWLGSQYDILNATNEAPKAWPLGLELIHKHIQTIDIKDGRLVQKEGALKAEYLPIGEGITPFEAFIAYLKKFNINAPFSMHFEFDLGGADIGSRQITMKEEKVITALKKDLAAFKTFLTE